MLEALSQTLHSQQQSYIDQKSVLGALSNLQGFSQTETSSNLSVTAAPTPAAGGKTTSAAPQAPTLDTAPALQGFKPNYGPNASDLLNDQINLSYQIFNLQMILERSLSDRLEPGASGDNKTRLQGVLGFNVTIDPPRTADDAVAVVEITLTSKDGKPLSLVSLMPQEKTYNSAALSNKSNAFGGAAAVSAFQIGYSARKRSQIFYLYRDTDTLSYERMTGDPRKIVFGWMFRPVLGRHSVSPGLRQMFAIMALPNVDCLKVESTGQDKDGNICKADLSSTVRTYWKKYDRATLSSFEHEDANRARNFWYGLSLGLGRPQIFDDHRYENGASYEVSVESSATYQTELTPTVESIEWRPIGTKNVIVSVKGNNFFTNTQVAIGDKIYAKLEEGLILKSNQGFDLTAPVEALVNGPGTIIGRYGLGVPLIQSTPPEAFGANGVKILGASIHPSLAGHHRIEIQIQGLPSVEVLSHNTPVISVNGKPLELPYHPSTGKGGVPEIQADVPDADLADGGGLVKVSWPFYPAGKWTDSLPFYDPDKAFEVTRVSQKSILIHRIDGPNFLNALENTKTSTCWKLIVGDAELPLIGCPDKPTQTPEQCKKKTDPCAPPPQPIAASPYVATVTIDSLPDQVVLVAPSGAIYNLAVPALKAKDDKVGPIELKQYDSLWIEIMAAELTTGAASTSASSTSAASTSVSSATKKGTPPDLSKLSSVEANGKDLKYVKPTDSAAAADPKAAADKTKTPPPLKSIKVEITRDLTSKPGTIDIGFHAGTQLLGTRQLHITQTDWGNKGDK